MNDVAVYDRKSGRFNTYMQVLNTAATLSIDKRTEQIAASSEHLRADVAALTNSMSSGLADVRNGIAELGAQFNYGLSMLASKLEVQQQQNVEMLYRLANIEELLRNPDGTKAKEWLDKGIEYLSKGLLEEALDAFHRSSKVVKASFLTHYYIGKLRLFGADEDEDLIDLDEAIGSLDYAIKLGKAEIGSNGSVKPLLVEALFNRGVAWYVKGVETGEPVSAAAREMYEKAARSFEAVVEYDALEIPASASAADAEVLKNSGAEIGWSDGRSIEPATPGGDEHNRQTLATEARYHLAKVRALLGDNEAAEHELRNLLRDDPMYGEKARADADLAALSGSIDALLNQSLGINEDDIRSEIEHAMGWADRGVQRSYYPDELKRLISAVEVFPAIGKIGMSHEELKESIRKVRNYNSVWAKRAEIRGASLAENLDSLRQYGKSDEDGTILELEDGTILELPSSGAAEYVQAILRSAANPEDTEIHELLKAWKALVDGSDEEAFKSAIQAMYLEQPCVLERTTDTVTESVIEANVKPPGLFRPEKIESRQVQRQVTIKELQPVAGDKRCDVVRVTHFKPDASVRYEYMVGPTGGVVFIKKKKNKSTGIFLEAINVWREGRGEEPGWSYFEDFLKERCLPKSALPIHGPSDLFRHLPQALMDFVSSYKHKGTGGWRLPNAAEARRIRAFYHSVGALRRQDRAIFAYKTGTGGHAETASKGVIPLAEFHDQKKMDYDYYPWNAFLCKDGSSARHARKTARHRSTIWDQVTTVWLVREL